MSKDFLLDPNIRFWVFLPIVLLTLLVEIVRHYSILLCNNKTSLTLSDIQDMEMKKRVSVLQRHYGFIPKFAFEIRKISFHPETGFLKKRAIPTPKNKHFPAFSMHQHENFLNIIKGYASNHLPMLIAGAWVSYTFSGFICTKVPFPLTFSFKSMLQRNIELFSLDPSWVSSCSWYFLNVFGLRNILSMFFEEQAEAELSEADAFREDVKVCFKEDFNNLEIILHENELSGVKYI